MISSFVQKPLGVATILGAAVGAPYAAFETDFGQSIRKTMGAVVNIQGASAKPDASQLANGAFGANGGVNASMDPYSLSLTSQQYTVDPNQWSGQNGGVPSTSVGYGQAVAGGAGYPPNAPIVMYGPATVTPMQNGAPMMYGVPQPMPQQQIQSVSPNYIAANAGTSNVVPGSTPQLWDYTLGTPTLPQMQQQPTSVGGGTVGDLREVLRFDIKPGWLPQRFSRVTTVLSNVQMDGLRVPLVTGIQPSDLAGSLTYYFDGSQALNRINLHGLTGDPSKLANLMVQFYQLKPEQSLGGQLFTTRWNNRVTSLLHIAPAPIIYAGADHSKYIVFLELNQPNQNFALSDEAAEILRQAAATQRW